MKSKPQEIQNIILANDFLISSYFNNNTNMRIKNDAKAYLKEKIHKALELRNSKP